MIYRAGKRERGGGLSLMKSGEKAGKKGLTPSEKKRGEKVSLVIVDRKKKNSYRQSPIDKNRRRKGKSYHVKLQPNRKEKKKNPARENVLRSDQKEKR